MHDLNLEISNIDINNYLEYGSIYEELKEAISNEENLTDDELKLYETLTNIYE